MVQPTYPIRTARLTLRPVTMDDLNDVYAYQRRADVVRWMLGMEPQTREQSRASVAAMARDDALRAEGDSLTLAVVDGATVVGTVTLFWRSEPDRTAELGYVFHPDHGGRGLATEAATALLDWGFDEFGLHRVYARCHSANAPSARLMARLGMRREALHVRSYRLRGEWADQLVYAVLADEWRGRGAAQQPPGEVPRLRLIAVVDAAPADAAAVREYEDRVLALLDRHGGRLEQRLVSADGCTEVQTISFADEAGYRSCLADPQRAAYRAELGDVAPEARVIPLT